MAELNNSPQVRAYYDKQKRRTKPWEVAAIAVALAVGIGLILSLNFVFARSIDVEVGMPAPQEIIAPVSRTYVSDYLTSLAEENAVLQVDDIYTDIDLTIGKAQVGAAQELFSFVEVVKADSLADDAEKSAYLQAIDPVQLDAEDVLRLLGLNSAELSTISSETIQIIETLMREEIREDDMGRVSAEVRRLLSFGLTGDQEAVLQTIVPQLIKPTFSLMKPQPKLPATPPATEWAKSHKLFKKIKRCFALAKLSPRNG